MLNTDFLVRLLACFEASGYSGLSNIEAARTLIDTDNAVELDKFIYHMDEIWNSELIRWKHDCSLQRWGLVNSDDKQKTFINEPLVLTPAGSAFIEKLNQDNGISKFKELLKSSSILAGKQALAAAITRMVNL